MRRGLASLITGLSLLVATVSWAGFTLSHTILDPGRSERLAERLLDDPQVREALIDRLADAVEPQIPAEVPVSRGLIETGAGFAIDDPQVRALILDGVVRYHRNALEGNTEPVVVDGNALGRASRDSLVGIRPELDPFLPATPAVQLELPTTGFTWLASVKRFVDRYTILAALVALAGSTVALAVARDRGAVLRRVAFWGYGAAAFWLVVGFALPRLADLVSPTSGAIASAAVDVFFGAMTRPAVLLAVASTATLALGFATPVVGRRRGARVLQPSRPGGGPGQLLRPWAARPGPTDWPPAPPPSAGPTPIAPPAAHRATIPSTPGTGRPPGPAPTPATATGTTAPGGPVPTPSGPPAAAPIGGPPPDRTTQMPRPMVEVVGQQAERPDRSPAWREGVGYLDEDSGASTRFGPPDR
jgi:hypothetical protein